MIIAADIGGTKTDIALIGSPEPDDVSNRRVRVLHKAQYPSAQFSGLSAIVADFLSRHAIAPATVTRLCAGVAGPVVEGRVRTPNLPWHIDSQEMEASLRIGRVTLINDLEAAAERTATLSPGDVFALNEGRVPSGPLTSGAVIAAGTGLGMAVLHPVSVGPVNGSPAKGSWRPVASEGGHADFAPRNETEIELLRFLQRRHGGRVSNERVLSGPGLAALYDFVVSQGLAPEPETAQALAAAGDDAPRIVGEAGLSGRCPAADRALDLFVSVYGAVAGNLALTAVATGGVFVAGGIAPKILPRFRKPLFMDAFVDKGRLSALLRAMPVKIVLDREAGLGGAAWRAVRLELGVLSDS